jgi:hypothetical protein
MKYFSDAEMSCKHCGLLNLHPGFAEALVELRETLAEPMAVASGCRCLEHNTTIKGHKQSLHIGDVPAHADKGQQGTLAVDVAAADGGYRGRLFVAAWRRGWSIGWNSRLKFLHLDRRDLVGLPQTSFDY